jgi:hypothetical protein
MVVSPAFHVSVVQKTFDENGVPSDPAATEKRANNFIESLLWYIDAARDKLKSRLV